MFPHRNTYCFAKLLAIHRTNHFISNEFSEYFTYFFTCNTESIQSSYIELS